MPRVRPFSYALMGLRRDGSYTSYAVAPPRTEMLLRQHYKELLTDVQRAEALEFIRRADDVAPGISNLADWTDVFEGDPALASRAARALLNMHDIPPRIVAKLEFLAEPVERHRHCSSPKINCEELRLTEQAAGSLLTVQCERERPAEIVRNYYADARALPRRARSLLERYGAPSLSTFAVTEAWLSGRDGVVKPVGAIPMHAASITDVAAFAAGLRDVPPLFWSSLGPLEAAGATVLAMLMRVRFFEEMHDIELARAAQFIGSAHQQRREHASLRLALRQCRNSHFDMVAFIFSRVRSGEILDAAAAFAECTSPDSPITWREALDPALGERALHEGDAPRLSTSYEYVDFFSECGLSALAFSHMRAKLAPRCCGCREYDRLQDRACSDNKAYFYLTLLDLEIGLTGAYAHAFEAPSFWRALELVAPLRRRDEDATRQTLLQFQINHPQLSVLCGAEAMVRAIQDVPQLRTMLCETYPAWREFEASTRYSMDVVRRHYSHSGSLAVALAAAGGSLPSNEPQQQQMRSTAREARPLISVYRHRPHDYVTAMARLISEEDKRRYLAETEFGAYYALTSDSAYLIDRYVATLEPASLHEIDLEPLRFWGMSDEGIALLRRLEALLLNVPGGPIPSRRVEVASTTTTTAASTATASTTPEPPEMSSDPRVLIQALKIRDYNLAAYLFARLARHNGVRATRIGDAALVAQQTASLHHHNGGEGSSSSTTGGGSSNAALFAGSFVVSQCCATINTPVATAMDARAHGAMGIAYDRTEQTYVCVRKETRLARRSTKRRLNVDDDDTLAAIQRRERNEMSCGEMPVTMVPGIGLVVETLGYRLRKRKNRKSKQPLSIVDPPAPPFWLAPCCGAWVPYRMEKWTANSYCCGACSQGEALSAKMRLDACIGCGERAKSAEERLVEREFYDDVFGYFTLARYRVCARCDAPRLAEQPLLLSLVRRGPAAVAEVMA